MFGLTLAKRCYVKAYIVDSMGRVVERILQGELSAGKTNFPVRKGRLASGAYQLVIEAGNGRLAQPFNVVK